MKNLNEFTALFAEQLNMGDTNKITPSTAFRNLDEWTSLAALSVIAMADDEFEVALKSADIKESNTIEDLYNRIISKV